MARKEIVFIIDKQGRVTSTIRGVKGSSCEAIAAAFKSLGKVSGEARTSEYYENGTIYLSVQGTSGHRK